MASTGTLGSLFLFNGPLLGSLGSGSVSPAQKSTGRATGQPNSSFTGGWVLRPLGALGAAWHGLGAKGTTGK